MKEKRVAPSSLTAKQEAFVRELVKGKSQREAYIKAYGRGNKKDNTIDQAASRTFNTSKVYARYQELLEEVSRPVMMDAQAIIDEYNAIAKANVMDYLEVVDIGSGIYRLKPKANLKDLDTRAIKKLTIDSNGNPVIELWDKKGVLDKLAEINNVVSQTTQNNITINMGGISGDYCV